MVVSLGFGSSLFAVTPEFQVTWQNQGQPGFSEGVTHSTTIDVCYKTPYVLYADQNHSNKATAMKYEGGNWETIGSAGFSAGSVFYPKIITNASCNLFAVYTDGANSYKSTMMKFDGNNWIAVGSAGFSAGRADYISGIVKQNLFSQEYYVVYKDVYNFSKATVMEYDGSNWVTVGAAGFSAADVAYTNIAIGSQGILYVVYKDYANESKATVMKYDGSNWVTEGPAGFSTGAADYPSIDHMGNKSFVAYTDENNSNKATVMYFDVKLEVTEKPGSSINAVDIDGDGDLDVLSAFTMDPIMRWSENNGSENFPGNTDS